MKKGIYILVLLASLFICTCGEESGQKLQETNAQTEKMFARNLSNENVYSINQDKYGQIWIGTFRGLNKYDGLKYAQYFCFDNNEGLFDNHVNHIFRDSQDRIWVATVNGVCRYRDDDRFDRLNMEDINRNVTAIFECTGGRILMYSNSALLSYNPDTESLDTVLSGTDYPMFATFYAGIDNTVWAVNGNKIYGWNADTLARLGEYECAKGIIWNSCILPDGDIWACTNKGFCIFNTISRQFKDAPAALNASGRFKPEDVYKQFPIGDNRLIIATNKSGLFLYDITEDRLLHQFDKAFPFNIPSLSNINCVFRDEEQNIWFGLEGNGYYIAERNANIFSSYRQLQDRLKGEQVASVATDLDGSTVIAATKNSGIITYDLISNSSQSFPDISSTMLHCDSRGNIWSISTNNYLVEKYAISKGRLRKLKEYNCGTAVSIAEDASGNIWFGGMDEKIAKYDPATDSVSSVDAYTDNVFTFIPGLLPVSDTTMLVAGFYRDPVMLNTVTGEREDFEFSGDDIKRCIKRSVMVPTVLFKDIRGLIWIGTVANGLLCYDPVRKSLYPVEGAPCVDIASIEQDRSGDLWVSTMYGIGRFDSASGQFANFYFEDKDSGNQFYDRSSCTLPDGTVIFGGTHGITTVKPNESEDEISVPLIFEDLNVFNETLRPSRDGAFAVNLCQKPEVKLLHNQNSFSISFAALDYTKSGRSHYYYMLEGYDKQWHDAGSDTQAYYTRVGAGRYTFKVRYEDDSHSIVSLEDSLSVRILAAPFASWWAILCYSLIVLGILHAFYRFRRNIQKAEEEKRRLEYETEQEKRLNKMNMSFFANVAHEFRTPLTTITGPLSILADSENTGNSERKLIDVMKKSTDRMMSLVNQFLDFNKLENDTLKLQVSSHNITEDIRKYAELFEVNARMKNISISTEGLDDDFEMLYDQDKLYKMLSNLITNAIKYTETGGAIRIGFHTADDGRTARIFVADNGIGIAPEFREKIFERYYRIPGGSILGTGIGLYYVKALAGSHHGSVVCEANEADGKGSVFTISLPADASAYKEEEKAKDLSQSQSYPISKEIATDEDAEAATEGNGVKILVVDDDVDICNYLKILLNGGGYDVKICFDADSALASIKEWEPDLVLCDVAMPVKDGNELCRTVREDFSLSHIPLIMVTAKTSVSDQVEGLNSGADAYITKPFDPKYLFAVIRSQLDKRQKIQKALNQSADVQVIEEEESLSVQDKAFLAQLYKVMEDNISDIELDVNDFANSLHISRTKLYYKVKGLTGESPAMFFKNFKLNKAAEMICDAKYNMSEISDRTGFASLSHFSTSFKKHFGMAPSEYAKSKKTINHSNNK